MHRMLPTPKSVWGKREDPQRRTDQVIGSFGLEKGAVPAVMLKNEQPYEQ